MSNSLTRWSTPPKKVIAIHRVYPELDCGCFAIQRVLGESIQVEADIFAHGHDRLFCRLLWRHEKESLWHSTSMEDIGNDRWRGTFLVEQLGKYWYTIEAWVDRWGSWLAGTQRRLPTDPDWAIVWEWGAWELAQFLERAQPEDRRQLEELREILLSEKISQEEKISRAQDPILHKITLRYPDPVCITRYCRELPVQVDPKRALFSTWYELFPRSASRVPGQHGTLRDCEARLEYVARLGFDVLYLPPIHPIGRTARRGKNNQPTAAPEDPGSPWAIGDETGGHTAIHPQLGTLDDFRQLVRRARQLGIEIAMDLAFHCSPDHPYVRQHPEWFVRLPSGQIRYAENPPKKYPDIYPFNFEGEGWQSLWEELKRVVLFWVEQGVRTFRVDNPHTKPFAFWEWLLSEVKQLHPDVIFLSEAFTRPKVMYQLAKLGFSQSYTYFTWRNTKEELTCYFEELFHTDVAEFFRPNLWPNTPDILHEYLQKGGPPAFAIRLILAATLSASYGIYGPAFEVCEREPREPGSEEYRNSEKYEIRHWDWDTPTPIRDLIARINRIRREHPALQQNRLFRFHWTDNPAILAYSKWTADGKDRILVVVNLNPFHVQSGFVEVPIESWGLPASGYLVEDILAGIPYHWEGNRGFVILDPSKTQAHILWVRGP
ncbi:alpha-1,4-glucan--maltose-1-phosphate maltosyltransferase [Candidatus Methylacidithermus pantelleriae]|uniref:Alpha-1,4-glucan:maltose-1-phosphate maltosyltransferase n=1 Tax=Candidatus Methylacidithermus pantelleriae TaxID=2744239 RepID=A0A8J2BGG6_9BACT|nr:alpha-1,4-glucan--maltose-1-phosphate maltosyltransferase [Candidatus Methylacidithermus pantelleriae]CAF0691444.1 Alpha-1,4-glucan:maltose-1-phosphate maltosyltransferase [Candidatus Methylacidithermus pantelleriae]